MTFIAWQLALLVLLAGGVGALLRFAVVALLARLAPKFPWGVLVVNVLGSAVGGTILGLGAGIDPGLALVLLTGFAGGFTTFSTFTVDTVQLAERDENLRGANLNAILNLLLSTGVAFAAFSVTRALSW